MSVIYLNIGSNKGNRRSNILRAVAALRDLYGNIRLSRWVESEPWGYDTPHRFLNLGVAIDLPYAIDPTARVLHGILDATQAIERSIDPAPHRNDDGSYRDRTIDIDIIEIDNIRFSSERLTIPHPHADDRPFVAGPLTELKKQYI